MKNRAKILFVGILSMLMVLTMMPTVAFAANGNYDLRIGGVRITDDTASGEGWSWDGTTRTLTLDGFQHEGNADRGTGIYYYVRNPDGTPLTIKLVSENKIYLKGESAGTREGIYVSGADLILDGSGSLEVYGGNTTGPAHSSYGIRCGGNVTIQNCSVTAQGGDCDDASSYGLNAKCVSVKSGVLNAISGQGGTVDQGDPKNNDVSYGIWAENMLRIFGGTVTAASDNANYWSDGIEAGGVIITGGTVTASAGQTPTYRSSGIYSGGAVVIKGGTVSVSSTPGPNGQEGYGIKGGSISIPEGSVDKEGNPIAKAYSVISGGIEIHTPAFTWATLQEWLNEGGEVVLPEDVTAGDTDTVLSIPKDKTVTLDLAGHTIDRHLTEAVADGSVLRVLGTLVLEDSSEEGTGKITGGNNSGNGGGVQVLGGTLTIEGGSITKNKAAGGAGVYVARENPDNSDGDAGKVWMNGGSICENEADSAAGVLLERSWAQFSLAGGEIKGNKAVNNAGGVGVYDSSTFRMSGGTITENKALKVSGIYMRSGGRVELSGGSIVQNYGGIESPNSPGRDSLMGGVYLYETANGQGLKISGDPIIKDNIHISEDGSEKECNVYLRSHKLDSGYEPFKITIVDMLGEDAEIGVSTDSTVSGEEITRILTSGLKDKGSAENFFTDDQAYRLEMNEDGDVIFALPVVVTFDANDGSGATKKQKVSYDFAQALEPNTFTLSGYRFTGWNTAADGSGNAYSNRASVTLTENLTLYAQWKKKSSSTKYDIEIEETENGTVSASFSRAANGYKVTVTAKPDEGYTVDTVSAVDKKGNEVALTDKGDGTYTFTMPKADVTVTAAFKADESGGQHRDYDECRKDNNCPIYPFKDSDPKAWYHDGVHWAIDEGVMNGTSQTTFEPNNNTTRAMIVTMLWRMEGEPAAVGDFFTDVDPDSWYGQAVNWAAANEIVKGYNETTFGPKDPITREQLAAILYRYAGFKGNVNEEDAQTNILDYEDASSVSDWATEAMQWSVGAGVITGMTETTLVPQGEATRAQVATMLMRYCN